MNSSVNLQTYSENNIMCKTTITPLKEESDQSELFKTLKKLNEVKAYIKEANEIKATLEKEIFSHLVEHEADFEGTTNYEVNGGLAKIKTIHALNYKVIADEHEIYKVLEKLKSDASRERIIKFEPKISVSEIRKLSSLDMKLISPLLEIKPKKPTLTFEGDFS